MNLKIVVSSFPAVALVVLVCLHFFDTWVALTVLELLKSYILLHPRISNIPDVLFLLVCCGSTILWSNYFILRHRGIHNIRAQFSRLAGSAVPLAYFLKWICKYVFGRTNTRVWLLNQVRDEFHWFHGRGDFSGFPSGHMAVFSAFFFAVWMYYPRLRSISVGLLLVLAGALVATDYHFLSDVIAGAYLGLISTCLARVCFDRCR